MTYWVSWFRDVRGTATDLVLTGAIDLILTEEEIKELSDPYEAQAAFGHA